MAKQSKKSEQRDSDQRGYVTAMTALLLIPLMVMAALAVDVGAWYSEASSVQTAADSASLAGVPYLPNMNDVVDAALDEARRNGYVDADGHSEATYQNPTSYPQILVLQTSDSGIRVLVKNEAPATFGQVVTDSIVIERGSTSEFIKSVPMGNPTSQLGGGHLNDPNDTSNSYWLSVAGYCSKQADGTRHYGGYNNFGWGCSTNLTPKTIVGRNYVLSPFSLGAATLNLGPTWSYWETGTPPISQDWYTGNGVRDDYFAAIELSSAIANNIYRVEIYKPGACVGHLDGIAGRIMADGGTGVGAMSPRIRTRLFNPDQTLADQWDSVRADNIRYENYWELDDCDGWYSIGTIGGNASQEGTHYLSYGSDEVLYEVWKNVFALRVVLAADPTNALCTDISHTGGCPTISAVDNLPIYIHHQHEDGTSLYSPGDSVDLYLANIGEEHAGKTLVIKLFDAGEGMSHLQILSPSPAGPVPIDFSWETTLCADSITAADPDGHCGTLDNPGGLGSADTCADLPCLSVRNLRLQHNEATISIDIPSDYSCTPDCWWRVRYYPRDISEPNPRAVTDATEWSISLTGDPIRLAD